MPPIVLQVVAQLKSTSGLPTDVVENVLNAHSAIGETTPARVDDLMTAVVGFYNNLHGSQTLDVANRIASSISRTANACKVLCYATTDFSGATPLGSPIGTKSFTLDPVAAGGLDMPEEVSSVISYNGDLTDIPVTEPNPTPPPATIRPAQRRRGRMFIGPLRNTAGTIAAGNFYRPESVFRADLGKAFAGLAQAVAAISDYELVVWSKSAEDVYPVVGGYVDDAWDTQRRRGVAPTTRTAFVV